MVGNSRISETTIHAKLHWPELGLQPRRLAHTPTTQFHTRDILMPRQALDQVELEIDPVRDSGKVVQHDRDGRGVRDVGKVLFDDGVGHDGFVVAWGDDHGERGAETGGFVT